FVKGADFVAANVFMFASTNLVIELGIVLIVLMGWQFAAAEFVGGAIMAVLLALAGGLWLRGRAVAEARSRLERDAEGADAGAAHVADAHAAHAAHGLPVPAPAPLASRLRSKAAWADAATYTMADLKMLRRELVIGYVVAGFLATVVPAELWSSVFVNGHGTFTTVENVAVGPFIALISFVCSIGNVPLAAALWKGGISFGGVVAFVFADLITFPLLLIYRRFYGSRLALRMLAIFWLVMSTAGLVTEVIFRAAGLVPAARPRQVSPAHFAWDYTTYLNIAFLVIFGALYLAYRNRDRLGGGRGYAIDPICGMQVETAQAPASCLGPDGKVVHFCSDRCKERYEEEQRRSTRTQLH
ncbi:MAG: permease, partial [Acidimicrobiales bacterium]